MWRTNRNLMWMGCDGGLEGVSSWATPPVVYYFILTTLRNFAPAWLDKPRSCVVSFLDVVEACRE